MQKIRTSLFTMLGAWSHFFLILSELLFKRTKKMQWTREGAHNVLQIRGLIESNEWNDRWQEPVMSALVAAE